MIYKFEYNICKEYCILKFNKWYLYSKIYTTIARKKKQARHFQHYNIQHIRYTFLCNNNLHLYLRSINYKIVININFAVGYIL